MRLWCEAKRTYHLHVLATAFDPKRNSLNFLRLVLATCVLVSHAAGLGQFGSGWVVILNGTSLAQFALYGFFVISGFLLAGSAMRGGSVAYMWRRCLRIFPGLIACLVVTAFVFGFLAWYNVPHPGCGLSCYLTARNSPVGYVLNNALLANPYIHQNVIAGTPRTVIPIWNSSIWTLFYEFACYVILLGLGLAGFLRHRRATLGATLALWSAILLITITPTLAQQFNLLHFVNLEAMMRLSLVFFTGTMLYLYRDRIPDSGWLALASAALYVLGLMLPVAGRVPTYNFTMGDVFLPFAAYPVLWLGCHLPLQRIGAANDYSYGVYVYGWPVTTLLVLWGASQWGPVPFILLSLACTVPFAIASWWLVEKRAMSLKSWEWWRAFDGVATKPVKS